MIEFSRSFNWWEWSYDRWHELLPAQPLQQSSGRLEPLNILTFLIIWYLPPANFYNAMSITTGIDLEIAITN